jgi:hypothetical protein
MPTIGQYLDNGARLQTKMVQGNDYLGQWGDVELLLVSNALVGAFDACRTTGQGEHGLVEAADWEGFRGGSNRRPSVFQELYHPESTYPENAPTAQLTRIDAADRLFSVPLTRITSVPECAVSSVGFLWGPPAVSRTCGVSVGPADAPDSARQTDPVAQFPEAHDHFRVT